MRRIFVAIIIFISLVPTIAIADEGRYQFREGYVIDTATGAVWRTKTGPQFNFYLVPVPYPSPDGKTYTLTPDGKIFTLTPPTSN